MLPGLNAPWSFFIGNPKGPEVPTLDRLGRWQEFEKGAILWHPNVDRGVAAEVEDDAVRNAVLALVLGH